MFSQPPAPSAPVVHAALDPAALHPALWLGHQLARANEGGVASGFEALDAQLPGKGWPRRSLTELLLPHAGLGELRLVSPAVCRVQEAQRLVMVFDPPQLLCAQSLVELGWNLRQLVIVDTRGSFEWQGVWALEQALRSGHVGAVLAWLSPRQRAARIRRLQLAAQAHDGPAFLFREPQAAERPTAAPLRLALQAQGVDAIGVRVLKRRGPPLASTIRLELPRVLSESARRRSALVPKRPVRAPQTALAHALPLAVER